MMQLYQHRPGRTIRRFQFECVESCHKGTDDPEEFAAHLAICVHIFPAVRTLVQRALERGEPVAIVPRVPREAPGQMELP